MKLSSINLLRLIELDSKPGRIMVDMFSRIDRDASSIGPCLSKIVRIKCASSLRIAGCAIGSILRLARRTSPQRLEAACKRVLFYGFDSIDMVKTVLMQRLDSLPLNHNTDIYGQPELF